MNQWNNSEPQDTAETVRDSRAPRIQSCRQRVALFKGLQVESMEDRLLALEKVFLVVRSYIRSCLSPSSRTTSPNLSENTMIHPEIVVTALNDEYDYTDDSIDINEQIFYYLITLLRLSMTCPYIDIRQSCKDFLIGLKDLSNTIEIPQPRYKSPSHFILSKDIFSLESNLSSNETVNYPRSSLAYDSTKDLRLMQTLYVDGSPVVDPLLPNTDTDDASYQDFIGGRSPDEYVRLMMINTFLEEGRLSNLYRVLAFFPTFFEIFHITYTKTFKAPMGPLHRTWRSFIGLMVASEQKCQYLVSLMKMNFLHSGGDPTWMLGLDHVPHKLRMLSGLIMKLARQPWACTQADLMLGLGGDAWSKGELVQATLIIATTLGLSSFILGCGITPEIDMMGGFNAGKPMGGIENELDLPPSSAAVHDDIGVGLGVSTQSSKNVNLRCVTTINQDQQYHGANVVFEDISKHVDSKLNETVCVERFEENRYMQFMLGEYCFEDHGCDLMNHYLPSVGDDLVSEFNEALSITDWSIFHPVSDEVVDTSPLRNAIWYYTLKVLGVVKEDYAYTDIPAYLNDRTMKYIEDVCTLPHTIQLNDWCNLGIKFRPEEKCHVNLLIASARKQAILCYGLCLISENL